MLIQDYKGMLSILLENKVDFLLVGEYTMVRISSGQSRFRYIYTTEQRKCEKSISNSNKICSADGKYKD